MEFTGERFILGKIDGEIEVEHLHRYQAISNLVKGKKVLDSACGEGFGTAILSKTADEAWGIDLSEETVIHAQQTYKKHNLFYKQCSIEKLDFEDHSFDVIVSYETIEHVDRDIQSKFLDEVHRVLKKDGIFIISTPDKYLYSELANYQNPYHVAEFYDDEFKEFLENHFKKVEIYNQNFGEYGVILGRNENFNGSLKLINGDGSLKHGKFIIAVCSNSSTDQSFDLNSLYDTEKKIVKEKKQEDGDFFQYYWNKGQGFSEHNSQKINYSYGNEFKTMQLAFPDHVVEPIRIDLGSRPAIYHVKKDIIVKSGQDVELYPLNIKEVIGMVTLNDPEADFIEFISMSHDPQIVLENDFIKEIEFSIYLDMKAWDFEFNHCMNRVNQFLDKSSFCSNKLNEKEMELNLKEHQDNLPAE